MPNMIRPFARPLLLCDSVFGYDYGKTELYGLFNAIRPATYPHVQSRFCLFAQLTDGLGEVPFYADVIFRPRDELIWTTNVHKMHFLQRELVVQLVLNVEGCPFPEPGAYLLELYCAQQCVADVPLQLLQGDKSNGISTPGSAS
jgi:hypothetical protein